MSSPRGVSFLLSDQIVVNTVVVKVCCTDEAQIDRNSTLSTLCRVLSTAPLCMWVCLCA